MKTKKDTNETEITETEPKVVKADKEETDAAPSNATSSRAAAIEKAQEKDLKSEFKADLNAVPDHLLMKKE